MAIVESPTPVSLVDKTDPRSVVNLVPTVVREAIETAFASHPQLFELDERRLWRTLRDDNRTPTPTDNLLRLTFWLEYDSVQALGTNRMSIKNVVMGASSTDYFYRVYLNHPHKVAWLLCAPVNYVDRCEEALNFGLTQLRDILDQDHGEGQRVNVRLGELKAKIVGMLDARVKGAVVQRSMQVQVHTSNAAVAKMAMGETMEELQKQIKDLDRRARRAQNMPVIEQVSEGEKVGGGGGKG